MDVDAQKVKREGSEESPYDILDETVISDGIYIEEIEDLSKVENSGDVDNNALKRQSNEECQYDILDKTDVTDEYVSKDELHDGLNIEEFEDLSKVDKTREVEDSEIKRESNEEFHYDIFNETDNEDGYSNEDKCNQKAFEAIIDERKLKNIEEVDKNKMQQKSNEEFSYDVLDDTDVIDGFLNANKSNEIAGICKPDYFRKENELEIKSESKNILEDIEDSDALVVVSGCKEDISEHRKCNQTHSEEEELKYTKHIEFSNMKQKSFESNLEKRNVISVNKETKRKFVKSLSRCDTIEEKVETETETIALMKKKIQKILSLDGEISFESDFESEEEDVDVFEDDKDSEPEIDIRSNNKGVVNIARKGIRCNYCYKKGSKGCMMEAMDGWEENIDGQALVVYKCMTCQSMSLK